MKFGLQHSLRHENATCAMQVFMNDKSRGGIEMQRSSPVLMFRTKLPSLTPFKGAMSEIYTTP